MGEFKNFKVPSVDNILPAYNSMLPIMKSFNGDPEKFYPQFYKAFSSTKNLYKNPNGNCNGNFLSFEVANHILAQLFRRMY